MSFETHHQNQYYFHNFISELLFGLECGHYMLRCRTEFNETLVCRRLQISINGWTINDGWINHRYLRGGRSFWLRQKLRRNTSVHLFVRYFGSSLPENLNLNNISSEIRTALLALSQLSAQLSAFYILSI